MAELGHVTPGGPALSLEPAATENCGMNATCDGHSPSARSMGVFIALLLAALCVTATFLVLIPDGESRTHRDEHGASNAYPARMVVCRERADPSCAAEAARRARRTVAWLPAMRSARPSVLVADPDEGSGTQVLEGEGLTIWIESSPRRPPAGTARRTLRERGAVLQVFDADSAQPSPQLVWSRGGERFSLTALGDRRPASDRLIGLWRQIRYATPR